MYNHSNSDQTVQTCARQKSVHLKRNLPKRRTPSITLPIKHRRDILNQLLIRSGGSLIHVQAHNHDLISKKNRLDKQNNIITINVSGNRYQTHLKTLENYPNTLLGNEDKRRYYWNDNKNEYFFDRHQACFEAILYYYQSNGRLRRPDYVPLDTFFEEVSFFDLGPHAISQINQSENVSIVKYIHLPNSVWRRYIWFYLEYPQHSLLAKILYFLSMIFTVLSCLELAIETLPTFDKSCENQENTTLISDDISQCSQVYSSPFFIIQTICVAYFTIEFLLRVISTPSYYRFLLSIFNWIDLAAIVPYFVFLALALHEQVTDLNGNGFNGLRILRILRFLRVFKIYLIFKELKSLRVLSSTLKESFIDFIIMIVILTLMGFLFGATTYFVEQDTNGDVFDSIPKATYWGILTITTVGYGDIYPITVAGRILACSCAFFGVATSAMLVSVLVDRYQRVYNRKRYFPEQIVSAADSSSSELEEKQDFINRRVTSAKKSLFAELFIPSTPTPSVVSPNKDIKYHNSNSSSSNIRFIISCYDDQKNNKSIDERTNELMEELTKIIRNSEQQLHLKLITPETDSVNHQRLTIHELPSISEE